ncbi:MULTISPECIES: GNAT family N-acetyltransferase [Roseobacteraceae]|uniref:GNAT family N-acetyltransferase n=1 Tax=Roseobacteraceae TaxID=2854170 RepID=UPI001C46E626|nr:MULTISPECIES: GNAT family N-acetyltransferase [Roseobacteraceae]MBV7408926.1 GNAT family N-acetyltransferase [Maritimibacter sp. DP1N21-5]MBY5934387.1 GNAT family N-acetyltransferase [Tateyamaria omphalii]
MIRNAARDDAAWIADIWNAVITHTQITFTTAPKSLTDIEKMIECQAVLVLQDRGGFATYGPFRSGPGYAATVEHTILLADGARGRGHGRALLTALEARAAAEGHHIMVAGISGTNDAAIAFHSAMGFSRVGHMPEVGRKGGVWLDLVLMQKRLGATASADAKPRDTV